MAETLPSPPPSPTPEIHQSEQTLSEQLDALLEQYLELLDTYTALCETLSKSFSAGFLSLAQAQRHANSTIGPGRRFGQESYDERMKALGRIQIQDDDIDGRFTIEASETGSDPLKWFGILVPPALRQTQAQFTRAVQETVPGLLNIESRMGQVEQEIWDVRKQLGILDEYKT